MCVTGNGVTLTNLTASTLSNNAASGDGGALFLDGSTAALVNNTFVGNQAAGRGGAVAYLHSCFLADALSK